MVMMWPSVYIYAFSFTLHIELWYYVQYEYEYVVQYYNTNIELTSIFLPVCRTEQAHIGADKFDTIAYFLYGYDGVYAQGVIGLSSWISGNALWNDFSWTDPLE